MMNVPGKGEEEEENLLPLSPSFDLQQIKGTEIKVSHRFTLGDVNSQTMCTRFDPHDKYIAQGCHDGKIRIWNVFTGNESFCLNEHMDQPMPTMMVRWRPEKSKAITKNVILSVNANGALQHWHTTSGKLLHTIFDELNQLLACDYNYDGTQFVAGGSDSVVRVYDEQTRGLMCELQGGGSGAPGHSSKVFCVKFDQEDPNLLVSGGWDFNVMIWDIRQPNPIRSVYGPLICGDAIDLHQGFILTGAHREKNQLQLWDFATGELLKSINWDDGLPSEKPCMVYEAQFMKNESGLIIAGGSGAHEVKIFDASEEYKPIAQIRGLSRANFSVEFSKAGDMIATGGGDGVIRVFNIVQAD